MIGVDRESYAASPGPSDIVINAAGNSNKRAAESDPRASFDANVAGVLTALLDLPCDTYVHISSTSVYPDVSDPARCREDAMIDPATLPTYGLFKLIAEWLVRRHARHCVILRVGNVVGPGLRKNPIYDLLTRSRLFIDPRSTLSFIDTSDVAKIVWQLRGEAGQIFNVAGDGAVVIREVAARLGIALPADAEGPLIDEHVNIEKLRARLAVPASEDTVLRFCHGVRSGTIQVGG